MGAIKLITKPRLSMMLSTLVGGRLIKIEVLSLRSLSIPSTTFS
ncbi:MAG: hypothetical protein QXQ37_06755 [Nitrososphaerota archaeon]